MPLGLMEAANADCTILAPERRACGDALRCDRARPSRFGPRALADPAGARLRQLAAGAARSRPARGLIDAALFDRRRRARAVARGGARGAAGQQFLDPAGAARAAAHARRAIVEYDIPLRAVADYGSRGIRHAARLDRAVRRALPRSGLRQRRPIVEDRRPRAHLRGVHRRADRVDRKSGLAPGRSALAAIPRRCPAAAVRRRELRLAAAAPGGVARRRIGGDRRSGRGPICRRRRAFARGFAFPT